MNKFIERYKQHVKKNFAWAKKHIGTFSLAGAIGALISSIFGG